MMFGLFDDSPDSLQIPLAIFVSALFQTSHSSPSETFFVFTDARTFNFAVA